jgi:hypothetical protein
MAQMINVNLTADGRLPTAIILQYGGRPAAVGDQEFGRYNRNLL